MYGTGSAPANGAASPPTGYIGTIGIVVPVTFAAAQDIPWSSNGYLTGLTIGTAYWVDVQFERTTAGSCALGAASILAVEQ
jgi:hypothetical protein